MADDNEDAKTQTFHIRMSGDRPQTGGQRSDRKSERPRLPATTPLFNRGKSDMISYEDLLVTRYLDDLKRQRTDHHPKEKQTTPSPYLQRLPHNHLRYAKHKCRPMSAHVGYRPLSGKPKIDARFIADPSLWDPATPRDTLRNRPASAPVRHPRPYSGVSHRSRPPSGHRSSFRKQPNLIKAFAYVNGSRDKFSYLAAVDIDTFLELATEKLGLPFAARRIFQEDGVEITTRPDLVADSDVYISMGQQFKDPYQPTRRNIIARNKSVWTMTGIEIPENGRKKSVKPKLSRRMRALSKNDKLKILVFKNGNCTEPAEVVTNMTDMDEFLMNCTARLGLPSPARIAYDVEGCQVTDLSEIPRLFEDDDPGFHQSKNPVRGPVWISLGEYPVMAGMVGFLLKKLSILRGCLKRAKKYKENIDKALDNEDGAEIDDQAVSKMSVDELYEASAKVEDDISNYTEKIKEIKEQLSQMGKEEEGHHVKELEADNRLVGIKGIKLKVYENGLADGEFMYYFNLREALKGLENNPPKVMQRLLDELSFTRLSAGNTNRNLNAIAQMLFNQYGNEIKCVSQLKSEQPVWLSFGEPFISPFTYCLQIFLDKATKVQGESGEERIVREAVVGPEMEELVNDSSKWEATIGFPALYEMNETQMLEYDKDKVTYLLGTSVIDDRSHYLLMKDLHSLALYPELGMTEKSLSRKQIFVISKSGVIYSKAHPQLCLAVTDSRVEATMFSKDTRIEGFVVSLQKKMVGNPSQTWRFSETDATISCEAYPNLFLTYLGNKTGDEESYLQNMPAGIQVGQRAFLVVADPLPKKDMSAQRFAVKQERCDTMGQWKFTQASNPEWNKLAYSWPVKEDGTINEKYEWPMEGFILPNAPPLHKGGKNSGLSGTTPVRLKVLKNGERCIGSAISVVGPNLSSMLKNNARKEPGSKNKKGKVKEMVPQDYSDDIDDEIHCLNMTWAEVELQMFLAHCTALLDLPFAARRLFDANGCELFSLENTDRNQLVYISCGEQWFDPKLTKKEQNRRFLLSQLSSDVLKIQHYCALRNPENYVLEIDSVVGPNSPVIVSKQCGLNTEERHERGDGASTKRSNSQARLSEEQEEQSAEQDSSDISAHERSHLRSEDRLNTLKWPWERLVNVNNSMDTEDPEANKYTDKDLYEKFKPQSSPRVSKDTLQKFVFEDGFIASLANRTLVLAASETEGRVIDVVLVKRKPDDINQRWLIKENGEIRARANQHMVLTVSMPATAREDTSQQLSFDHSPVTVQTRRTNAFGKAHQRWRYDAETGFIHAFCADLPDKEITAANRAVVCTYAIAQGTDIDQPGYIVEIPNSKNETSEHKVCISCARAMRGRYKVQRLPQNTNFHCAMGDAKALKIQQQVGSFKVLNNKVDLSTFEAEISLKFWEDILYNLRKQTNVHTIAKEINAAKAVRTVKVLAFKNGEGRLRKGEIICGSSIEGILAQCAHRLGMTNAARMMYMEDGELVVDVDDLIRHAVDSCKNEMINMVLLIKAEQGKQPDNRIEEEEEEDDEAARLERFQRAASEEVSNQMRKSLDLILGMDKPEKASKEEHHRGRGMEEDEEDNSSLERREDESSLKDLDTEEAMKIKRERDQLLNNMKLPPLGLILRAPIEVWVSSGKAFVSPEVVESKEDNRRKKRQFRAQVGLALDMDKHVLRQVKGRRLDKMEPGVYKSTLSCKQPVVLEKHWQEPTVEEQDIHHSVHKLQTHLGEIKNNQEEKRTDMAGINLGGKLYKQPNMKRILVYPNGETAERCVYVWGDTVDEILDAATLKLGLWKRAKALYNLDGQKIEDFDGIERDQLLCVSTGKSFKQPTNEKVNIEVKANWGRARKQYGTQATDVIVDVKKNPQVDVDPFGPPLLALPVDGTKTTSEA